jgi:RNA polymerase sigma factor for flagellar operon FliA
MEQPSRDQIVINHLPLVHKVVHTINITNKDYEHEDLVNIGVIGLMDAIDRYDSSHNVSFENYAYTRIKGAIIDEVRKHSRIPRSRMDNLNTYYKAKEELEKKLKRTPTEQEIAEYLGFTKKDQEGIYDTISQLANISLDEVLYTESDGETSLIDIVEDKEAGDIIDQVLLQEKLGVLAEAVSTLPERYQQLLQLIYVEELGTKEIAYILDISKARVSQLHGKALDRLRTHLGREYQ